MLIASLGNTTIQITNNKGADQTKHLLFAYPEDRFSRVDAHLRNSGVYKCTCSAYLHRLIVLIYVSLFRLLALLFYF